MVRDASTAPGGAAPLPVEGSPAAAAPRLRIYRSDKGGALGRITLCRERVLNALDLEGVEAVRAHLLDCAAGRHSGVSAVVLDSCTPRAFCAGGDVKSARAAVLAAPYQGVPLKGHHIERVFQAEYSTVVLTAELSRHLPLVALCDGIWMGLGFGLAGYCRHRVVTEGTVFAMPENFIGLWPDVGFAWRAARLASPAAGLYLALTGARVASAADLLWLGVATHYCPPARLPQLLRALEADPGHADATVDSLCVSAARAAVAWRAAGGGEGGGGGGGVEGSDAMRPGPLQRLQPLLERCFGPLLGKGYGVAAGSEAAALQALVERLRAELSGCEARGDAHSQAADGDAAGADLLRSALEALASSSPGSQAITLRHYAAVHAAAQARDGGGDGDGSGALASLRGVMEEEYRMAVRRVAQRDFLEGVRALLVDKDKTPAWQPRDLAGVDRREAAGLAAALPGGAKGLDLGEVDAAVAAAAADAVARSGRLE